MKLLSQAAVILLAVGLSLYPRAAEEKTKKSEKSESLPSAQQVLERYIKAIGGQESFKEHKSQHVTGTVEIPAQKLSGKMEVFAARPNKLVMKITMPAIGDVTTGYVDGVAWISTAVSGPMLLEGKMAEEVTTQADFDHTLHDPKDYKTLEVLGKEEFNGEECYKLNLVHNSGFTSTEYFSVKTGLQVGFVATQQTPFGAVKSTTLVGDYRKFGDLFMPARQVQKASGIETVTTIEKMELDNVDASALTLPPEVKTLVAQKNKQAAEETKTEKPKDKKKD